MNIATTRTFRSGDGEAVKLPKEMAFGEGVELELMKSGNVLTMRPKFAPRLTPRELVEALGEIPKPEAIETREPIEWPERPGL